MDKIIDYVLLFMAGLVFSLNLYTYVDYYNILKQCCLYLVSFLLYMNLTRLKKQMIINVMI